MYRRKSLIWFWISLAVILPAVPLLIESVIQGFANPRGLLHIILLYISALLHVAFLLTTAISFWFGIRAYIKEKSICYWLLFLSGMILFMMFQYEIL